MYPLLNYLDAPVRFLIFTVQEALCLVVPFMLGVASDHFWCGASVACVLYAVVRGCRRHIGLRRLRGFYYWHFPTRAKLYTYPIASYMREFVHVVSILTLCGCQGAYNDFFDCPAEHTPRCQNMRTIYAHYAPEKAHNCLWYYVCSQQGQRAEKTVVFPDKKSNNYAKNTFA